MTKAPAELTEEEVRNFQRKLHDIFMDWTNYLITASEKQGKRSLGDAERGYCCLGILCDKITNESYDPGASYPYKYQMKAHLVYMYVRGMCDRNNSTVEMVPENLNDTLFMPFKSIGLYYNELAKNFTYDTLIEIAREVYSKHATRAYKVSSNVFLQKVYSFITEE